jgi:DNA-directed RNA polymerase subunit A'
MESEVSTRVAGGKVPKTPRSASVSVAKRNSPFVNGIENFNDGDSFEDASRQLTSPGAARGLVRDGINKSLARKSTASGSKSPFVASKSGSKSPERKAKTSGSKSPFATNASSSSSSQRSYSPKGQKSPFSPKPGKGKKSPFASKTDLNSDILDSLMTPINRSQLNLPILRDGEYGGSSPERDTTSPEREGYEDEDEDEEVASRIDPSEFIPSDNESMLAIALARDSIMMKRRIRQEGVQMVKSIDEIPEGVIDSTTISVMSFKHLVEHSVTTVSIPRNDVAPFTVNDPQMGVLVDGLCATCKRDTKGCPGHYGRIIFNAPILHPMFIKQIIYVLSCLNIVCGGLRLNSLHLEKISKFSGMNRLEKAYQIAIKETRCLCEKCESSAWRHLQNIKFEVTPSVERGAVMYKTHEGQEKQMTVAMVEDFLSKITPKMARDLGFDGVTHPVDFIMKGMIVIPPVQRPPTIDDNEIKDEQLTGMYIDLVKTNNAIAETRNDNERSKLINDFKKKVSFFFDNSDGEWTQGHSVAYKGIKERLSSKAGLRGQSQGKRVVHAGRTVIGPDMDIRFGEVSIPRVFSEKLSQPVTVTAFNRRRLQRLLIEGVIKSIKFFSETFNKEEFPVDKTLRFTTILKVGDIVRLPLGESSYAIINRQPSLHKYSLLGMRTKIRETKTMGLHLANTGGFNADFDGDEMNLHVPQTNEGIAETMIIMNTTECLMNAQNNKPVVGHKLDVVTGFRMMTKVNSEVDPDIFYDCINIFDKPVDLVELASRAREAGLPLFCTFTLVSALFPKDFYYRQGGVHIERGILRSGVIGNEHVGPVARAIHHFIFKKYGRDRTVQWMTDSGRLPPRWMTDTKNLTFGIAECMPRDRAGWAAKRKQTIDAAKMSVFALGPAPDAAVDPIAAEKHEEQVRAYLNIAQKVGEEVAEFYSDDNSLLLMTQSGAKGKSENVSQITSLIGQQYLRGKRLLAKRPGGRTISHFLPGDDDPASAGFVENSYYSGTTGGEYFMLQVSSREGLVDTANTTATVGSMNHRVAKALEDIHVEYDLSVRNSNGIIIQPLYGYEGFSGSYMMPMKMPNGESVTTFLDINDMMETLNAHARAGTRPVRIGRPEKFADMNGRITSSRMTHYEVARVVGIRANQISKGAPLMINPGGEISAVKIAMRELHDGVLPMIIRRYLPGRTHEEWDVREMNVPFFESDLLDTSAFDLAPPMEREQKTDAGVSIVDVKYDTPGEVEQVRAGWSDPANNPHIAQVLLNEGHGYTVHTDLPFVRVITPDFPREPYRRREDEIKSTVHWGQRKLLMSEVEFITKYGKGINTVVYAGAAPGTHIKYLADLFPEKKFILYDPRPFTVKRTERITPIREFFTDDVARSFAKRKILFISDVRTFDEKSDLFENRVKESAIIEDMEMQKNWHNLSKAAYSMLKFRLPYTPGKTMYLKGDDYLPVWGPLSTTETRLIVARNAPLVEYDHTVKEEQMFYFNTVMRPSLFPHNIVADGFDNCYDCSAEISIWHDYLVARKKRSSESEISRMINEVTYLLTSKQSREKGINKLTHPELFSKKGTD